MGEIITEANRLLNGNDARVQINVTPDIENLCFDIGIEIIQKWEIAKKLLGDPDIQTATNLLNLIWLGVEITGGTLTSLFVIYKLIKKRRPISIIAFFGTRTEIRFIDINLKKVKT